MDSLNQEIWNTSPYEQDKIQPYKVNISMRMIPDKHMSAIALLVIALIIGCAPDKQYAEIATTITGTITDSTTSSLLSSVTIRTEPPSQQVTTNSEGTYRIETNVVVGEDYTVFATKEGYVANNANVTVREGENTAVDIQLTRAGAILSIETPTINFGARKSSLPLTISNIGSEVLNYNINDGAAEDWLIIEGDLSGAVSDIDVSLTLKVNRTGLPDGSSSTQFVINSNGGNETILVTVEKLGENEPRLSVNPDRVNFTSDIDQLNLNIENLGTGILTWEFKDVPSWLSVDPAIGDTSAEIDTIQVTLNRDSLRGRSTGVMRVESNHTTVQIPINVSSSTEPLDPDMGIIAPPLDMGVVDMELIPEQDMSSTMPPTMFTRGDIQGRIASPNTTTCGLTYHQESLWLSDCTQHLMFHIDLDGNQLAQYELPNSNDVIDMASTSDSIFVLFESGSLWRFDIDSNRFVDTGLSSSEIDGVAFDGEFLCTWQGRSVYRRNLPDLSTDVRASADEDRDLIAYGAGKFFSVGETSQNGVYFQTEVKVFRADNRTRVTRESSFMVAIDASIVNGIAADEDTLWLIGRGVGVDAGQIVQVQVR